MSQRDTDVTLDLASHRYLGRSVGSEETCHQFPSLGLCFDMGRAALTTTKLQHVFITHGHQDHVGDLPRHLLRRDLWGLPPGTYYIPEADAEIVEAMMEHHLALSRTEAPFQMEIIGKGSEIMVRKDMVVRPFESTHCIPCTGYAVWHRRRKLKPEFEGLGAKLGALRRQGVEIDDIVETPEIAYPGDTSIEVLTASPVVTEARVLLLECTFLDSDGVSPETAHRHGHIHIDHFIAAAREGAFKNKVILLTHFSARYSPDQVRQKLGEKLRGLDIEPRIEFLLP